MRLVDDNQVGLGHGIGENVLRPHIGREQNVVALEGRSRVGNGQFADLVFPAQRFFELFQQHQSVAKDDYLLVLVESFDDLACEHGLAGAGRRFQDESAMLACD